MSGISISVGTLADLDAVIEVMEDSFDQAYGEAWTAAQCAGLLPVPGVWLSLARASDRLLGFALARIVADEAELLLLAVRPADQRRGVGTRLLNAFCSEAARRGAVRVHLEVRDGNQAVKLYERSGFARVGRRRDYYRGPVSVRHDALTLAKKMSPAA
jgi:ribosomal-protein-alanine N-acetyltransferase